MSWATAALLAVALAGCASTGGAGAPCEKCDYGYVYVGKRMELKKWCNPKAEQPTCCIKEGKMLDCTKNPPECPECAKNAGK